MLMGLNGRAGRPGARSAIGCAAPARRSLSLHPSPRTPTERRAVAPSTAAANTPVIGRRRAPVRAVPR